MTLVFFLLSQNISLYELINIFYDWMIFSQTVFELKKNSCISTIFKKEISNLSQTAMAIFEYARSM